MRTLSFVKNEHYHLVGRGVNKQRLFQDNRDYARFLFGLLHLQSNFSFGNILRIIGRFQLLDSFEIPRDTILKISDTRDVVVIAFCLMPNHFHILVKNVTDSGVSRYMHRVVMGYAKYFNTKHNRTGHVFQGPFRAKHIKNNAQLLHTSAYIHRNPREIGWKSKEASYIWSSYKDYIHHNRWDSLIVPNIILEQFKNGSIGYKDFVTKSTAKV